MIPDIRGWLAGMRVPVIEDVTDIRDVFVILLPAAGASVAAVGTGAKRPNSSGAASSTSSSRISVFPTFPGTSWCARYRQRARIRIVVITGYGEPYLTQARQAGARAVFTKPVEWNRVLDYLCSPDLAASA